MNKQKIPPEIVNEYSRARNLGAVLDLFLPLAGAIAFVLITPREALSSGFETEHIWLAYALVAFSVTTCLVARIVFTRLMQHVKRLINVEAYRKGKLTFAFLALFALYLCPAVWGFGYYMLTGSLVATAVLVSITPLSYIFLTPPLESIFKD